MKNNIFQKIVSSILILSLVFSCKTSSQRNRQVQVEDSANDQVYQNYDLIQQTNVVYYLDDKTPLNLADQNDNSTVIDATSSVLASVAIVVGIGVMGSHGFKEAPGLPKTRTEELRLPKFDEPRVRLEKDPLVPSRSGVAVRRDADGAIVFKVGEKITGDQAYLGLPHAAAPLDLKFKKISALDQITFKPEDTSAFVVLSLSHPLVRDIPSKGSVVRGLVEYRVLTVDAEHAVLQAINLQPTFRKTGDIKAELARGESIPKLTFRQDPLFSEKIKAMQGLRAVDLAPGLDGILAGGTRFSVKKQLGKGSFGTVYLVEFTPRGGKKFQLAVKAQDLRAHEFEGFVSELQTLEAMSRHPDSTQYFGTVLRGTLPEGNATRYYSAMEVLDGDWIKARDSVKEGEKHLLMISAADAYVALHASGRVHYDTKAQNLLFSSDGRSRVADYGFATDVKPGTLPRIQSYGTYVPLEVRQLSSPLAADGRPYDPLSIDTFGLGLAMIELRLVGRDSIEGIAKRKGFLETYKGRQVIDGDKLRDYLKANPAMFRTANKDELDLLFSMIDNDPWKRPPMAEVAKSLRKIHSVQDF